MLEFYLIISVLPSVEFFYYERHVMNCNEHTFTGSFDLLVWKNRWGSDGSAAPAIIFVIVGECGLSGWPNGETGAGWRFSPCVV
jgi:hypothetical protein